MIKGTSSILMFKVISAACSFLTNILIAKIYGPEIYGEYSLVYSIIQIAVLFNLAGLDIYVIKVINEAHDKLTAKSFLLKAFKTVINLGISMVIVMLVLSNFINSNLFHNKLIYIVVSLGLMIAFYSFVKFMGSVFRAHGDIIYFSIMDGLIFQLPIFTIFLCFYYYNYSVIHPTWIMYAGIAFGAFTAFFICLKFFKREYKSIKGEKKYTEKILKYSFPMMLTSSVIYIMGYLDTFFISDLMDNYHVGLYSGIVRLSLPLTFLSASLSGYIVPKISKAFGKNDLKEVKKIYKSSIFILFSSGLVIISIYFFFPTQILGLFGKGYESQVSAFRIYTLSTFLSGALFGPIGYFLVLTNLQKEFLYILIITLVINVVLNYLLIPKMGISGSAVAILVATVFRKLVGFLLLKYKGVF